MPLLLAACRHVESLQDQLASLQSASGEGLAHCNKRIDSVEEGLAAAATPEVAEPSSASSLPTARSRAPHMASEELRVRCRAGTGCTGEQAGRACKGVWLRLADAHASRTRRGQHSILGRPAITCPHNSLGQALQEQVEAGAAKLASLEERARAEAQHLSQLEGRVLAGEQRLGRLEERAEAEAAAVKLVRASSSGSREDTLDALRGHLLAQQQKLQERMEALAGGISEALPGQVSARGDEQQHRTLIAGRVWCGLTSTELASRNADKHMLSPAKRADEQRPDCSCSPPPTQVHDAVTGAVVEVGRGLERRLAEKLATKQDLQTVSLKVGVRSACSQSPRTVVHAED